MPPLIESNENGELTNLEQGNLFQSQKRYLEALKCYDAEYIKFSDVVQVINERISFAENDSMMIHESEEFKIRADDAEEALYQKAVVYRKMNNRNEAILSYSKAIEIISKEHFKYRYNYVCDDYGYYYAELKSLCEAEILRLQGKYDDAMSALDFLIPDPEHYSSLEANYGLFSDETVPKRSAIAKLLILEKDNRFEKIDDIVGSGVASKLAEETSWDCTVMSRYYNKETSIFRPLSYTHRLRWLARGRTL